MTRYRTWLGIFVGALFGLMAWVLTGAPALATQRCSSSVTSDSAITINLADQNSSGRKYDRLLLALISAGRAAGRTIILKEVIPFKKGDHEYLLVFYSQTIAKPKNNQISYRNPQRKERYIDAIDDPRGRQYYFGTSIVPKIETSNIPHVDMIAPVGESILRVLVVNLSSGSGEFKIENSKPIEFIEFASFSQDNRGRLVIQHNGSKEYYTINLNHENQNNQLILSVSKVHDPHADSSQ